jgi:Leucine-rich repeat (LRR) protein
MRINTEALIISKICANFIVIIILQLADEVNLTAWIKSDSLRELYLAGCGLTRLPHWLVSGLPAIEKLDVTNNQLTVLPMLTLVTTCRLRFIGLGSNMWSCQTCDNSRAKYYLKKHNIDNLLYHSFCPTEIESNCELQLTVKEELEKSLCCNTTISNRLYYTEPPFPWLYVVIGCVCIFGLVFLTLLANTDCALFYACKKTSFSLTPTANTISDEELSQVTSDDS